jgi:hypothetical protein
MKTQYAHFENFLEEVERASRTNLDFHVGAGNVRMEGDEMLLVQGKEGEAYKYPINSVCHRQLAEKTKIPYKYYEDMKRIPGLRSMNVNEWIRHNNEVNFLRVQDGHARAFLSDAFMPIDNFPILRETLIPVLSDFRNAIEFKAMAISPTNMYIQAQIPSLQAEIKVGDVVSYGFGFRNSEVGHGAYDLFDMVWELACTNGRIVSSMLKKYHVGRRIDMQEESVKIYRDETIMADLTALKMRIADILVSVLKGNRFQLEVQKLKIASGDIIPDEKVNDVMDNVTRRYGLSENEKEDVLRTMWKRNDTTRYGVHNGITALVHKCDDPDRSFEFEKIGTNIIELTPSQWQLLTLGAA